MQLSLAKELYPKEAIIKAAYLYTDHFYVSVDCDNERYYVQLSPKNAESELPTQDEFVNEVLTQSARYYISQKTKHIRELVLGRALASTIITQPAPIEENETALHADDILKSWFEENHG